jgi:hypothetical protein
MDMRAPGLRRKSLADVGAAPLGGPLSASDGRIPTDLTPHIIGPMLCLRRCALDAGQAKSRGAGSDEEGRIAARAARSCDTSAACDIWPDEGEICRLRLEDVNWRGESLRIRHTKTNAYSAMPLLAPVGALLDYLRLGRPRRRREIFVRSCAPYIAMTNLYGMIRGRLSAAGVEPPGSEGRMSSATHVRSNCCGRRSRKDHRRRARASIHRIHQYLSQTGHR